MAEGALMPLTLVKGIAVISVAITVAWIIVAFTTKKYESAIIAIIRELRRNGHWLCRLLRRHKSTLGSLSLLPPEIRLKIYEHVLLPDKADAMPAHFHIYDKVYDSCMFRPQTKEMAQRRRETPRTALLRTCHAIHEEASALLYQKTHLELVVFAGLARSKYDSLYDLQHEHKDFKLDLRNQLGPTQQCLVLRRIRQATIVIQPGKCPDVHAYLTRVRDFLTAIDDGRHLRNISVKFNFAHETEWEAEGAPIVGALANMMTATHGKVTVMPCSSSSALQREIRGFQTTLTASPLNVTHWLQTDDIDEYLLRGAYGPWEYHLRFSSRPIARNRQSMQGSDWFREIVTCVFATLIFPIFAAYTTGSHWNAMVLRGQKWRKRDTAIAAVTVMLTPPAAILQIIWLHKMAMMLWVLAHWTLLPPLWQLLRLAEQRWRC